MDRLKHGHKGGIKAAYQAGYTIVLLDASMKNIRALHEVVGEGVSYRSKNIAAVAAYALRRENYVPTATLLTNADPSPLKTPTGDRDPIGLLDDEAALVRAADRTVAELVHAAKPGTPGPVRDPNQPIAWQDNALQAATFAINSSAGVYNTPLNVFALHRCVDGTDHYVVTAGADWTATKAIWQGATSEPPNPSMTADNNGNLVVNWQDNRTYCSSPGGYNFDDICRYINYPLSYAITMVPRTDATVVQIDAAPGATAGQATTYTSGFTFSIGGTVNVSAKGPSGGLSAGASWTNTTATTVPALVVDVSNTGNEGVVWNFKYCTTGLEPDPGTDCTSHVQMQKDVCQAQLGDNLGSTGSNPQQGQTPVGKFSDASESAHWQTTSRVGSTFDIEVDFVAQIGNTVAHLGTGLAAGPDPIAGCNVFGCACVSETQVTPVSKSVTFEIPFPSTTCK
ncbi:MAG: leukocidin family pore-forming toxin [Betaproteobacteria bacterium]